MQRSFFIYLADDGNSLRQSDGQPTDEETFFEENGVRERRDSGVEGDVNVGEVASIHLEHKRERQCSVYREDHLETFSVGALIAWIVSIALFLEVGLQ